MTPRALRLAWLTGFLFLAPGTSSALQSSPQAEQDSQQNEQVSGQSGQGSTEGEESSTQSAESAPASVIKWDQGLLIEALNKSFTLKAAGSAQNDSAAFSAVGAETPGATIQNGVEWRRARVFAEGIFVKYFNYKFQYDFAVNSPPNLKDAYVGFDAPFVPLKIRTGRFRAPLGLEGVTSGADTTFMERSVLNTFVSSRNTGVLFITDASRQAHSFRGAVGAVKPEDDFGIGTTSLLGVSARFSYAFRPRDGDLLIHAGGDYLYRPVDETVRFVSRPESHIAPQFTDTGDIPAQSVGMGLVEFAFVKGPLSFQTETSINSVNRTKLGRLNQFFWGGYAFVSYFLTGETRPYQDDQGNFGRQYPLEPFMGSDAAGKGAFEIAFRVSYLDLDDKEINGGRITDLTLGLNWYATRNARVLLNVIRSDATLLEDPVWIAQVRLQWAY